MDTDRITLDMSAVDIIITMADGNPGAVTVMTELVKRHPFGILDILKLDIARVYGSDIWIIYKDVCAGDIEIFMENLNTLSPEAFNGLAKVEELY